MPDVSRLRLTPCAGYAAPLEFSATKQPRRALSLCRGTYNDDPESTLIDGWMHGLTLLQAPCICQEAPTSLLQTTESTQRLHDTALHERAGSQGSMGRGIRSI